MEGPYATNGIAIVDVALCLALLLAGVPLLIQLCFGRNTPLFFTCDGG